jgi:hypothetical protein
MSSMGEFTFEALAFDGESGFGKEAEARFARRFAARRGRFGPTAAGPGPLRRRYPRPVRRPRWATPYPPIWLPWPVGVEPSYPPPPEPLAEPAADDGPDAPEEEYAFFGPSGGLKVPFRLTTVKLVPNLNPSTLDRDCRDIPEGPGLYCIHNMSRKSKDGTHRGLRVFHHRYFGEASEGIRRRFLGRMRVLFDELGLHEHNLQLIKMFQSIPIDCYELAWSKEVIDRVLNRVNITFKEGSPRGTTQSAIEPPPGSQKWRTPKLSKLSNFLKVIEHKVLINREPDIGTEFSNDARGFFHGWGAIKVELIK